MSTKTYRVTVTKKLTFGAASEQILVFNDPSSPNAFEMLESDGVTTIKSNQLFAGVFINNISDFDCYFSTKPNIVAGPTGVDDVIFLFSKDAMSYETGIDTLRIYLGGAGDVYITLF